MMRSILLVMFCLILVGMLLITTWASLDRSMLDAGSELMTYPWFIATLACLLYTSDAADE